MEKLNLIVFGPQASGKGTQARNLAERYNIPHISVGQMFRDEIEKGTEIGHIADKVINKGSLMPDEITNQLVEQRLAQPDMQNGFILDGYPRSMVQAEFLQKVFTDKAFIIVIKISDQVAIERISGRRVCSKCGRNYHIKYDQPKVENICDDCHESLEIREDDQPEAVKKRLATYHEQTESLIDYFKQKDNRIVLEINGEQSIDQVFTDIVNQVQQTT